MNLSSGIGKQHGGRVARACLDAHERRARRKPEQQHDIGRMPREQLRQIAIDRRVAGLEHMGDAPQARELRPPLSCQRQGKRGARIERRPGEGPKAGNEHGHHAGFVNCARWSRVLLDCGLTKIETTSGWRLQMRLSIAATAFSSAGMASRSAANVPINAITMPISAAESSSRTRNDGGSLLRVTASRYPSEPRSLLNSFRAMRNVTPSNTNEMPSTM